MGDRGSVRRGEGKRGGASGGGRGGRINGLNLTHRLSPGTVPSAKSLTAAHRSRIDL